MTNPHTPTEPNKRDESNQSAYDDMAKDGRWIWVMLFMVALGTFIAWRLGLR